MHEMLAILTHVRGVCLSVCHVAYIGDVPCARGHLGQPLPNAFGLLLLDHTECSLLQLMIL